MIRDIFTFFTGTYKVTVSADDRVRAVDIMYEHGFMCSDAEIMKNGDYTFAVTLPTYRCMRRFFRDAEVHFSSSCVRGLPSALKFLRNRPGIILGIFVFIGIMWLSTRIVWNIEVSGNENVSDEVISELLDELGCGYGDYIPSIDFDKLHSEFLVRSDDISWISVYMKGTHAMVQVREARHGESSVPEEGVYANLIAKEDAQIKLAEVAAGVSTVYPGDVVRKGDILVSGVIVVREDRVRYEYADAEVFAYVPRTIEVQIPFKNEKKEYTGRSTVKNSINFFEKSINLSLKGGIEYTTYDKIVESERLYLFGIFPLPVWMEKVTYNEYEYSENSASYEEAVTSAMIELRDRMDEVLDDAELVSNKMTTEITDEAFIVRCQMICITDIAEVAEFTVEEYDVPATE